MFKQIQSFHEKSYVLLWLQNFWLVENSKPVIDRFGQVNSKRMQNSLLLATFDFSTLYTILPHKDLLKVLFDLIEVLFDYQISP